MGIIHKAYRTIEGTRFDLNYYGGSYIHVSVGGRDVAILDRMGGQADRTEFRKAVNGFACGPVPRDIMVHVLPYL